MKQWTQEYLSDTLYLYLLYLHHLQEALEYFCGYCFVLFGMGDEIEMLTGRESFSLGYWRIEGKACSKSLSLSCYPSLDSKEFVRIKE